MKNYFYRSFPFLALLYLLKKNQQYLSAEIQNLISQNTIISAVKKETLLEKQIVNIGKIGDLNFQKSP